MNQCQPLDTRCMLKKSSVFFLAFFSSSALDAAEVDLYNAPPSSIKQFFKSSSPNGVRAIPSSQINTLATINSITVESKNVVRYQQLYKGIPVIGSQVIISTNRSQAGHISGAEQINGHISTKVQLNIQPKITTQQAVAIAQKKYRTDSPGVAYKPKAVLQIRSVNNALALTYLVAFKSMTSQNHPSWPYFVIDAQSGSVLQQWDNMQHLSDYGPGGNVKTQQYWYGKNGLPALQVRQNSTLCTMESSLVKLTHLRYKWDWYDAILAPYQYSCGKNEGDLINGGYAPANDAFYFGHLIVAMYKNWYELPVLHGTRGQPAKLLMRVHFGTQYENAFWDGTAVSFGDGGEQFYPLVSLDIAGHEVTHGFTQQHANLEYHDQSGALNESMSDMGGQAARAYLLATSPALYKSAYLGQTSVTWGIGETIMRPGYGSALRYMNDPSEDGSSADCLDRALAQSNGASCAITYSELVAYANANFADVGERQSYIVHTASGVYNKAFYLLANQLGIRAAYKIMLRANMSYWSPATDFTVGACGVLHATNDLKLNTTLVRSVFDQVGISTTKCTL
jgi:vibriolysin